MAFNESLTKVSLYPIVEEEDDGFHHILNSLSRFSICTSSVYDDEEEESTKENIQDPVVSKAEFFDGEEADGEVSDGGKENVRDWDSDKETPKFYSLPVTPSRRRRKLQVSGESHESNRRSRKRRVFREKKKKGISVSAGSNFNTQTSSGSNSPIATWRISSPGDDPKEVKARLKVWAQAVALASSSRQA
ncbi:unnamed protein product [Cochlearia groenlandica]